MNREQLAHVIRAAASIAVDGDMVIIGSQAVLGSFDVDELPVEATFSVEADVAFWDDPGEEKADLLDGSIGEESPSTARSATTAKASPWPRPHRPRNPRDPHR